MFFQVFYRGRYAVCYVLGRGLLRLTRLPVRGVEGLLKSALTEFEFKTCTVLTVTVNRKKSAVIPWAWGRHCTVMSWVWERL